jgi:hypothetical protein
VTMLYAQASQFHCERARAYVKPIPTDQLQRTQLPTSSVLCRPFRDGFELFNDLVSNFRMADHHVEEPAQRDSRGVAASDDEVENHVTQGLIRVHRSLPVALAHVNEAR